MANDFLFTSESVSEGHPDKVADQISDATVSEVLDLNVKSVITACRVALIKQCEAYIRSVTARYE